MKKVAVIENEYNAECGVTTSSLDNYPAILNEEYQALIEKKFLQTLTPEDAIRLQAVREEINAIDRQRLRPDTWDIQHQKLQEELTQIRAEAEALPKA